MRVVGVAGSHIRGVNSHGGISLGSRSREISREDVRQAVEKARSIAMPDDREPLHLLPQEFIVDGQGGVHDPAGLMGRKLEVRVHVVTAGTTATQNVVTAVNRAGIHVDDTVFEALACADSVLQTDERELGVCLADIGAGSTDLIVYFEGVVIHTGAIPDRRRSFHQRCGCRLQHADSRRRDHQEDVWLRHSHANPGGQRDRGAIRRRPALAHDAATHAGRNPGAARA